MHFLLNLKIQSCKKSSGRESMEADNVYPWPIPASIAGSTELKALTLHRHRLLIYLVALYMMANVLHRTKSSIKSDSQQQYSNIQNKHPYKCTL